MTETELVVGAVAVVVALVIIASIVFVYASLIVSGRISDAEMRDAASKRMERNDD